MKIQTFRERLEAYAWKKYRMKATGQPGEKQRTRRFIFPNGMKVRLGGMPIAEKAA